MDQQKVSRRAFLRTITAGGGMALLSACGSSPAATGDAAVATAPAEAPAAASGGPVTIRFMTHNILEKPAGEYLQEIVDEFMQQNPMIKVEVEGVPNADVLTKLTTAAQADNLPDIICGQGVNVSGFDNLNAALDIGDRIQQANIADSYFPSMLAACRTQEGRTLGLPLYAGTDALYYRTDMFEEVGLDPTKPPKTWDELVEAAKALTDPSKGRYGFGFYGKTHFPNRVINFMANAGPEGELMKLDEASGKYMIHINSPDSQKAWTYLTELALVHKVVPPNIVEMDYPANVSSFAAGNVAMLLTGPWGARTFVGTNAEIEGKFNVGPHPTPTGEPARLIQSPVIYGVGRTSAHPDEAFTFLKWITLDRNIVWNSKAGYGPVVKAALDAPEIKNDPLLPTFIAQSEQAVLPPYLIFLKENSKVNDSWGPEWQAALTGAKSVEEATNTAANRIKEVLGDRGELKFPTA
jgi:multiple sugar transport system substrate-binding protein